MLAFTLDVKVMVKQYAELNNVRLCFIKVQF